MPAWAEPSTTLIAENCVNCHHSISNKSSLPNLYLMPPKQIEVQLMAFKFGKRPATIMHRISQALSDEQIRYLANHFKQTHD